MVNINTGFVGGNAGRVNTRRTDTQNQRRAQKQEDAEFEVISGAHLNIIPANETIRGLVDRAVSALARGHYWDRGSILNLLV